MLDKRGKKANDELISRYQDTRQIKQRPRRNGKKKRLESFNSKTTTLQDQDVTGTDGIGARDFKTASIHFLWEFFAIVVVIVGSDGCPAETLDYERQNCNNSILYANISAFILTIWEPVTEQTYHVTLLICT